MSENVLLMFSYKSFMVAYLILTSLSHFEFIFMHVVWMCSDFTDLHVAESLAKETFPFYTVATLSKIN